MPRVIAGIAGGIKLETNKEELMRPTSDRMKEAVFSSLQSSIDYGDIHSFLDLFAGSGQIGIEAKSRGVSQVVLVEANPKAQRTIKQNLAKTRLQVEVLDFSAQRAIRYLLNKNRKFDIIYFDPPWMQLNDLWQIHQADLSNLLTTHGKILIEHSRKLGLEINDQDWLIEKEKNYGISVYLVVKPIIKENEKETG